MANLHTKLNEYVKRCDEVFLSKQLKSLVHEALQNIEEISVAALTEVKENSIIIDVREPEEFASGYISGKAVLTIPRGKIEFMAIEKIAKVYGQDAPIVTYCLKGARGALAAYQLHKMGFTNVKNLKGGILEWLENGETIENYLGEMKLVK